MARQIWQENYEKGRYNRWPYDVVISMVMRTFGGAEDRSAIRLLDLGCGGGNNTLFLKESGFDFRAVDAAPEGVSLTCDLLGLEPGDPRVVVGDFIDLPFDDGMFDGVIDRASLCCNLTPDFKQAIAEVRRVLKPGGRILSVSLYGERTDDLGYGAALGNGDYQGFTEGLFLHSGEVHAFTEDQIPEYFEGFEIEFLENLLVTDCSNPDRRTKRENFNLIARRNDD